MIFVITHMYPTVRLLGGEVLFVPFSPCSEDKSPFCFSFWLLSDCGFILVDKSMDEFRSYLFPAIRTVDHVQ